jgi:hypothetical protein
MFSNKLRKTTQHNQPTTNIPMPVLFKFTALKPPPQAIAPIKPINKQTVLPKMKWGPHIWTYFHTMSQKVKPEYFHIVKSDLINFTIKICNTLPCPICSQHASEYMRSINFNNIRSKEDLIQLFYVFHNVVNARKNYEFFRQDQLSMYEYANTVAVIKNFFVAYEDKTRAFKLMADDMSRAKIAGELKVWLNANLRYFEP